MADGLIQNGMETSNKRQSSPSRLGSELTAVRLPRHRKQPDSNFAQIG
jgi:hypothetical protein